MNLKNEKKKLSFMLGVHIPIELHDELMKVAEENDLTLSQIVRIALRNFLKQQTDD